MKHLIIDRVHDRNEDGVFGTADLFDGDRRLFTFFSLEEEWLDNKPRESCVLTGTYTLRLVDSPHFGKIYTLVDVPGRDLVRIHVINTEEDTEGCIGLGLALGIIVVKKDEKLGRPNKKLGITGSKAAIEKFMQLMNGEDGLVTIRWFGE